MRLFVSIFLLFTLVASVTVVVMKQVQTAVEYEFKDSKDANDSTTEEEEKESKSEKDIFAYKHVPFDMNIQEEANKITQQILHQDENFLSSLYSNLPFNPPEA